MGFVFEDMVENHMFKREWYSFLKRERERERKRKIGYKRKEGKKEEKCGAKIKEVGEGRGCFIYLYM